MALKSELVEKRNELAVVNAKVAKVRADTKSDNGELDLMKSAELSGKDATERLEDFRKMLARQDDLGKQVDSLVKAITSLESEPEPQEPARKMEHGEPAREVKSIGQRFVESKAYKGWQEGKVDLRDVKMEFGDVNLKTLITTGAGWAPPTIRTGEVVGYAVEPVRFFTLMPKGATGAAAITYMEETTRTQSAAAATEGSGAYAESTFALTERSVTVQNIGHLARVTTQQVEDVPQMQDFIDNELRAGLLEILDQYAITGTGVSPIPLGILAKTGLLTQAGAGDEMADAVYKAMTQVIVTGKANPSFVLCHPNDWQSLRLLRTTDGMYIWGNPAERGPETLWGLPVVKSTRITEGTALTGDLAGFGKYFERRGVLVEMTDSHDTNFAYGILAIRATVRGCFRWTRAAAFCQVTDI